MAGARREAPSLPRGSPQSSRNHPINIEGRAGCTIWLKEGGRSVGVIDQTRLPHRFEIRSLTTLERADEEIFCAELETWSKDPADRAYYEVDESFLDYLRSVFKASPLS